MKQLSEKVTCFRGLAQPGTESKVTGIRVHERNPVTERMVTSFPVNGHQIPGWTVGMVTEIRVKGHSFPGGQKGERHLIPGSKTLAW
jgi:hypothetical protein